MPPRSTKSRLTLGGLRVAAVASVPGAVTTQQCLEYGAWYLASARCLHQRHATSVVPCAGCESHAMEFSHQYVTLKEAPHVPTKEGRATRAPRRG